MALLYGRAGRLTAPFWWFLTRAVGPASVDLPRARLKGTTASLFGMVAGGGQVLRSTSVTGLARIARLGPVF